MTVQSDKADAARATTLAAKDAFILVRTKFFQGNATHAEAVAAAEAYIAAIEARKLAEPTRFRKLAVPSVARLMRG